MKILLLIQLNIIYDCHLVTGYTDDNRQHDGLSELLADIVLNRFPECEVIFMNDNYFQTFSLRWMEKISRPIHTINLEQKPHHVVRGIAEHHGSSGFSNCSSIIVCCQYKSSCRTQNSQELFNILLKSGVVRSIRRSFLYNQKETTNTFKPTSFYEKENAVNYTMPLMNEAKTMLLELKSHITLIRRFQGTSPLLRDDDSPAYHLIAFTPNWLPGGSPVLQTIWSKKQGFWEAKGKSGGLDIKLGHIRPGTVRVSLPNLHMLPFISTDDHGTATGMDNVLMTLLMKKFKFQVKYMEVEDGGFGQKLKPKGSKEDRWTGVIGKVIKKHADIGMGQIICTPERKAAGLQFSPTLALLRGVIVCPTPPEIHSWLILFTPFETNVWIILAITLCCILGLNFFFQKAIRRFFKPRKRWGEGWFPRRKPIPKKETWFTWVSCLGPILQQSARVENMSKRGGFRIFVGFLIIFGFAMSTFYGSVLIGKLSIYVEKASFESLGDLVNNGKNWVLSTIVEESLESTQNSDERKLLEGSLAIGVQRGDSDDEKDSKYSGSISQFPTEYKYVLQTGNCAVVERSQAAYMIHNNYTIYNSHKANSPLLRVSKGSIFLGPSSWVMRSDVDFILHEYLNRFFVTFRDFGFIDKNDKMHQPQKDQFDYMTNMQRQICKRHLCKDGYAKDKYATRPICSNS